MIEGEAYSRRVNGPNGVSLEVYAQISAALAEGDRRRDEVLLAAGVSDGGWREAQVLWNRAIAEDEIAGAPEGVAERYGELFARAQDALHPVPELTPEQWAEISDDVARLGVDVLAEHALREADYARLKRHWTATVARDRETADRCNAALFARKPPL